MAKGGSGKSKMAAKPSREAEEEASSTEVEEKQHRKFLVSMSEIGRTDGRFGLLHGNDDSRVLDKSLAELVGSSFSAEDLLFKSNKDQEAQKNLKRTSGKVVPEVDQAEKQPHSDRKKLRRKGEDAEDLKTADADVGSSKLERDFKKGYDKSVAKNKDLRMASSGLTATEEARVNRSATRVRFDKETMSKWDAAVHSRRSASSLSFPLRKADMSLKTASERTQQVLGPISGSDPSGGGIGRNPLEAEINRLLYGSSSSLSAKDEAKEAHGLVGLSMRETKEKLQELARIKAHHQFQQAKARRQNKIKSRKYRRQLRKEKKREMEQMMQQGQLPEGHRPDEDMEDLDRIQERATLKHTKASKNLHFLAKHSADKAVKNQVLAAKDQKKRELKEKRRPAASVEEDEASSSDEDEPTVVGNSNNPWTAASSAAGGETREADERLLKLIRQNAAEAKEAASQQNKDKDLNPNDFMKVNIKRSLNLRSDGASSSGSSNEDDEDEEGVKRRSKIYEAFADDDDILRDFNEEVKAKELAKEKAKKQGEDAAAGRLPGWGSWSGDTDNSRARARAEKRQKRWRVLEKLRRGPLLLQKRPPQPQRPGAAGGYNVIVSEAAVAPKSLREHQATDIPFPFTSVADFESSIRTPIGDTFVPRTSFKKMIEPKVKVAKGAVVEPADTSELVKRGIAFDEAEREDEALKCSF